MINRKYQYLFVCLLSFLIWACQSKQEKTPEVVQANEASSEIDQASPKADERYILFFGNSLTAGYGLEEENAFPSIIQRKLDEEKMNFKVINAGFSACSSINPSG